MTVFQCQQVIHIVYTQIVEPQCTQKTQLFNVPTTTSDLNNNEQQTRSALQSEVLPPSLVKCTNMRHNKQSHNMHSALPQKSEMYLLRTSNLFLNMRLSKTFCKILRNMATILHSWKVAVSWQGSHKPHYCSTSVLGIEEKTDCCDIT
jgi:hypothetical protein